VARRASGCVLAFVRKLKGLQEIEVGEAPIARFHDLVEEDVWAELNETMPRLAGSMRGRTVWNVNSTAKGGGVAELLAVLIPYSRGSGIDERWVVIEGDQEFFDVTKTIHNLLHGMRPQGASLTDADRRCYERTMAANLDALHDHIRPGDVAILHDPQTAGLIPGLRSRGALVVWRSHVGIDAPNAEVREAWSFLLPYVSSADAVVFSRQAYVWDGLERSRVEIITPIIDPFASKNRDLTDGEVTSILDRAGLRIAEPFVLQVSRWDRLKDPIGVMRAFAAHVAPRAGATLVLAGPAVTSVKDDPEQPEIIAEAERMRHALPPAIRERTILAQLPMANVDENALMVNALQQRAAVVVQKSLAEGFGLTVAEAMWKTRPVVASRVGGIEDQIEDGKSGLLIDDPRDLQTFGDAIVDLLADGAKARALGDEARRRVARWFLTPRHLVAQGRLLVDVVSD
jgi:trehalose synthase